MAIIKSVRGFTPVIGENTFLADNATGYYLPATEHERAACVRSMLHRADEIRKTAEAIDRAGV